jgi:NADH:ubiquinone oxidoreductase subunit 2 (subunit N)
MRAGLFFFRTIGIRICKGKKTHKTCSIVQFARLHRRSPLLAMGLLVGVFCLGGIPPTIGFTGKFLIFNAAMEGGYFFLVLIAMINVVISLYYYIMVVKAAFLLEPEEELPPIHLSIPATALAAGMVIVIAVAASSQATCFSWLPPPSNLFCERSAFIFRRPGRTWPVTRP